MIYIPDEWERVERPKQFMQIHITEHKKLRPRKDFGGHTMLINGKIIRAGLTTGVGDAMVSIVVNDVDMHYQINNMGTESGGPIFVTKGDVIKIRTLSSSGDEGYVVGANVSLLLEINI